MFRISSSALILLTSSLAVYFIQLVGLTRGEIVLGKMESWGFNGVESDEVILLSDKKIKIKELSYTGEGPAAWFMVGKSTDDYNEEFTDLDGVIIADENGSCDRLGRYRDETVELTLPGSMKFSDYDYLSIYCIRFSHNFGYIPIKRGIGLTAGNTTTADVQDDLPAECPQDPERRGGGGSEEEEEEEDDQ